ncbi:TolC family protein [Anaerotignum sp.]|uniref:TolC family protein n=1 Tax=Anaerotignum sp. TaxID=2039241 RepID=UPI0028ACD302|nr:TolC family protein [Anaerotignum sp.]
MGRLKYQKVGAFCLAGVLTFGMATPAFAKTVYVSAEEETVEGPMTLEAIQKQVLKNNRLQTTLNLNYKKVLSGLDAIDEGLGDLKDTQDSAARARKQAGDAASAGKDLVNAIPPSYDPDYVLGQVSSGLLSGSYKTANAMEDMTDSIVDQKRDELEDQQQDLKNTKQDLNKTQEDWNNQALLVSQLLVVKTAQVEKGIGLLEEKQDLMERLYTIEEKKESLGLSIKTDLKQAKLTVSENSKDVQDAKDGLTLLKRQINDLMGKPIDGELEIVAPDMARVIEYAPEYSEELLKEAKDKNYQLKTLRRDYQQAEQKTKDNTLYSGQIKAHQLDMDIAKVSMENQEIAIANDLKKKLDSINKAASAYQIQKDTYEKAKTQLEQQQKTAEVGMLSSVEIQALELQFKQNELALMAAAYDYDLAWEEYRLLMSGTSLDIYDTYKAQVGA